ncbi:Uncharacterised protein [Bordetella pertussis]|nr:Uncharacterised protein [Bordetella pertussis]
MVEDVALDALVLDPGGDGREAIDLDRDAVGLRLHHAHHHGYVLAHLGVLAQVGQRIAAEGADVGQAAAVGRHLGQFAQLAVGLQQRVLLGLQVVAQQHEALEPSALFLVHEAHAGRVQPQGALDAPPARLEHVAVVAVAFGKQLVGGHGGHRVVPVLHLDGMQRDVLDEAVGVDLRHLDPVADAQHVVGRELGAGHQRQQRVLEHQQQHRRQRAQAGDHPQRRAVQQDGEHQHRPHRAQDQLADLDIALDRARLRPRGGRIGILPGAEHAAEGHEHADPGPGVRQPAHDGDRALGMRHQFYAHGDHRERHRVPEVLVGAAAAQGAVPVLAAAQHQQPVGEIQHDARHHPLDEQRRQHQHADADQRLAPCRVRHIVVQRGDHVLQFLRQHCILLKAPWCRLSDKSAGAPFRGAAAARAGPI